MNAGVEERVGLQTSSNSHTSLERNVADLPHSSGLLAPAGLAVEKQGQARQGSSQVHPGRVDGVRRAANRRRKHVTDHRVSRRGLFTNVLKHVFIVGRGEGRAEGDIVAGRKSQFWAKNSEGN